ncbi:hypothetical protein [Brevibacterium sp. UCMA 11752]|uniref:hypothetical protein n=1 Tax=Brevibacterium sp. UCMA 11752 TaxID=2745946 RepID=UPI001F191FFD|nr:hypothetical protein [Brevibacterium sp. UCMA 11752]
MMAKKGSAKKKSSKKQLDKQQLDKKKSVPKKDEVTMTITKDAEAPAQKEAAPAAEHSPQKAKKSKKVRLTSIAFVESPLQFLSALEAHEPDEDLLIRARANAKGMTSFLDAFDSAWLPKNITLERVGAKPGVLRKQVFDRIYIGDACSGQVHKALALAYLERRMPEVVILDDGLATYSTIEILTAKRGPLVRPRQKLKASRAVMSAHVADRLRGLAPAGKLRWHTALPVSKTMRKAFLKTGAEITRHKFEHLQTLPTGGSHPRDNPVIGSALVADGLIHADAYRAWLEELMANGPITYYPHRRETDEFLAELDRDERVRIKHVGLPIELRLVNLPPNSIIRSLPSTAAISLSTLNPDVTIAVTEIPAEWWTGASADSLRKSLNAQSVKADVDS